MLYRILQQLYVTIACSISFIDRRHEVEEIRKQEDDRRKQEDEIRKEKDQIRKQIAFLEGRLAIHRKCYSRLRLSQNESNTLPF